MGTIHTSSCTVHTPPRRLIYPIHPRAIVMRFEHWFDMEEWKHDRAIIEELAKNWVGEPIPAYMAAIHGTYRFPLGTPIQDSPFDVPVFTLPYDHMAMIEALPKLEFAKSLRLERNFKSDTSDTPHYVGEGSVYTETKTYITEADGTRRTISIERSPYALKA